MNIAIRYYSKFGHSKKMADVIAQVAGVNAETVSVPLDGETDMLFLGAGVFLGKVDKIVLAFMDSLSPSDVKCVVLFGSSAIVDSRFLRCVSDWNREVIAGITSGQETSCESLNPLSVLRKVRDDSCAVY